MSTWVICDVFVGADEDQPSHTCQRTIRVSDEWGVAVKKLQDFGWHFEGTAGELRHRCPEHALMPALHTGMTDKGEK